MNQCRPPQMPWVSPYIIVANADQALDFYQKAFGFELLKKVPGPDGTTSHAEMRYQDQIIMLGKQGAHDDKVVSPKTSGQASPVLLYVYCKDVDVLFDQATTAGATVEMALNDAHWGDRMCSLRDPDGHSWCFATYSGKS